MWFSGAITAAVAQVQQTDKVLVVLGVASGESDQLSEMAESLFNDAEGAFGELLREQTICLRLVDGSETFDQFKTIFPCATVPFVHFIGKMGQRQVPLVGDEITERRVRQGIEAPASAPVPPPPAQTPAAAPVRDLPETSVESELQRQEELEGRQQQARDKIAEVRAQKEQKFSDGQREKERQRREQGIAQAEQQKLRDDEELKRQAEKKRAAKREDVEARARVKQQIEEDRKARKSKMDAEVNEQKAAKLAEVEAIKAENLRQEAERLEEIRRQRDTTARIQFRFHDGTTRTESFPADDSLTKARDFVLTNQLAEQSFTFGTIFPKRRFTREDEHDSFRQCGLTPSSTLQVIPAPGASSNQGEGFMAMVMALVMMPIQLIQWLIGMLTGANTTQQAVTQPVTQQPKSSTGASGGGARPRRNLGRLSDLDDDERKSQYNGNSTEQDS